MLAQMLSWSVKGYEFAIDDLGSCISSVRAKKGGQGSGRFNHVLRVLMRLRNRMICFLFTMVLLLLSGLEMHDNITIHCVKNKCSHRMEAEASAISGM